jgi:putative transposase
VESQTSLDYQSSRRKSSFLITPLDSQDLSVIFTNHVQIPRIGRIRSKEPTEKLLKLIEEGRVKILSATISQDADRFYVIITCMVKRQEPKTKEVRSEDDIVGVDLGLSSFAVLSDGTKIDAPKPLAKKLKLLKRRSKEFSRKKKRLKQ